ncbi:MAG: MgtC/SapB family protein [Hyphomicrobium sp.]
MDTYQLIQRLAVALAIGLIIGIERGWKQREEPEGERAAGLRTLTLSGLLGGVWGAMALGAGAWGVAALGLAFAGFTVVVALFRYREMVREGSFGATTVIAAMLAFALGAFAVLGDPRAAAAAGVATALLLALKAWLHAWLSRLTWEELRSGLILLAMTVIMLPLLPDREIGPWLPVNPREVWLMTIFIAALSFAGYVAIRIAGSEIGILLSGLAGGLVSSTAVTLNMAHLAREHPAHRETCAASTTLAGAMMMVRVLVVVTFANAALLASIGPALVLGALTQAGFGGLLAWRAGAQEETAAPLSLRNPVEFGAVLQFGALLAVIMALARGAAAWAGSAGAYVLAALSGVMDVDAISLSMARLAPDQLSIASAVIAILIAVAVNSAAKVVLATSAGGWAFGRLLVPVLGATLLAGAAGLWLAIH